MTASDDEYPTLLAVARRLAAQARLGTLSGMSRLTGGHNNQVYRVDTKRGPLVLKRYFNDPRDPRERLVAEWGFITHAWSRGIRVVPEPIAYDRAEQVGLYGFAQGRKLAASELTLAHIDAAIDFLLAVNKRPRPELSPASEACFSLAEHIETVEHRVARLVRLDDGAPYADEARHLISENLLPAWHAVKKRLLDEVKEAGLAADQVIDSQLCCLSPSDFGFHNALVDGEGHITFLDFEYSGCDDPAKLVSDFFCQPEVPVPLAFQASFIDRIGEGLGLDEAAMARCRLLHNAYQIKWTCIILNDFLPVGAARRSFADASVWAKRCKAQLAKAAAKLVPLGAII